MRRVQVIWGEFKKYCMSIGELDTVQLCGFHVLVNFII